MRSIKPILYFVNRERVHKKGLLSVLLFGSCLGMVVAGCQEPVATATGSNSSFGNQQTGPSMEEKALTIARQAIVGYVKLQKGSPVTVKREGDKYVVTFVHIHPPGTRGADYDARVTVDAATWKVVEFLVGS